MRWATDIWVRTRDTWSYRHEPEYLRRLASMYWRLLLFGAAFLIIGIALYGALQLSAALGGGEGGPVLLPRGGSAALDRAALQKTLDGFAAREAQYERLKRNRPQIADPSR